MKTYFYRATDGTCVVTLQREWFGDSQAVIDEHGRHSMVECEPFDLSEYKEERGGNFSLYYRRRR